METGLNRNNGGSNGAAVQLQQVVKKFKSPAGQVTVLKGIDLTLNAHEFVAIVGKSGSGKSTLLNMVTGIDHPTAGKVVVGGQDIYKLSESRRALWRGKNLGIVFQFFQLLPMLSLLENTMLPMDYTRTYPPAERQGRAMELLSMVGLEAYAHKLPTAVSTGQQQAAAIARALATDPPIVVADEPTGNLDSRSAETIIQLFDQLARQGKTIAMVTHDPSIASRTSRTVVIADGELVDETVARALPLLSHRQMLNLTHALEKFAFQPGQMILEKDQHVDYLFMVAGGQVEIVLQGPQCPDLVVAQLGASQFFGEVELVRGGNTIAGVRAAGSAPVQLVALHRQDFFNMLKESPLTEQALGQIVQARVEENRLHSRKCD
jgi:ABC-type lipoprotein export system ATPase subunit